MAYVHKIINKDEKLIGIARMHWIHIIKGVSWFFAFAAMGWLFDHLILRGLMAISDMSSGQIFLAPIMSLSSGAMTFMIFAGFVIFLFHVLQVISTEIALLDRRVIHKTGLVFVNVKQIDVEEIRGENLDLGTLGRFLGYGYIMLDCRFIGDVKLPAIDNPERFIRALHYERAHAQDALNLVLGKSGTVTPVNVSTEEDDMPQQESIGQEQPNVQPPQPAPEVQPPQPGPEVQPIQPDQIPSPPNEPKPDPGQQPLGGEASMNIGPEHQMNDSIPQTPEQITRVAEAQAKAVQSVQQEVKESGLDIDPATIAKVIEQVTPQITQQVVQQMTAQGLIANNNDAAPEEVDPKIDNDLINVFDEAALDKDGKPNDPHDKLEYAIH